MKAESSSGSPHPIDDEIDLADLLRQLWAGRKIILITTFVFLAAGIGYSVYKSGRVVKEYQSQVTLFAASPSADSLLRVLSYPPFYKVVLESKLTGLQTKGKISVQEALNSQIPPQGTLASLMNRVRATKGDANTLVISVQMQDQDVTRQLADSVVRILGQYLDNAKWTRIEKAEKILKEDSVKNIALLTETTSKNLKHLSKKCSANLQFLNDAYLRAESNYIQARQVLSAYYASNSVNPELVDSLEVNRLKADIAMKYNVYSRLYQQLEQAKVSVKNQLEIAELDAARQVDQVKIDAVKQVEQLKLRAVKQEPAITVLEPATGATEVNTDKPLKIPLIMLFFGILAGIGIVFGKQFYLRNFVLPEKN